MSITGTGEIHPRAKRRGTIPGLATATTDPHSAAALGDDATRAFSTSVVVSAIRCSLTYVIFPWLLPAVGIARGVGPGIGLTVGVVAIWFNVASIRRFHQADHPWKWHITTLNCAVIALLAVLVVRDLTALL